ncbi:MAG: hypothetical protein H6R27_1134 [Proteobacteria bacterium]|nr:hypothetical protein [Pseudomonadota bacterium]
MWRIVRIAVLLTILAFVALGALVDRWRTTDWDNTLWIGVFPVNADGRDTTGEYLARLDAAQFRDVEAFFAAQAHAHGVALDRPVHVELYPALDEAPPRLAPDAGLPSRVWWSLRARYFSWRVAGDRLAHVRLYVLYHDPDHTQAVPHSLGLQKGLFGIVHAYAEEPYEATNSVVVVHELMHTLGATDKYDPATLLPSFPGGYAEPEAEPRYPQRLAEVMAGRVALSPGQARMAESLDEVVVGPATAAEIGWVAQ